MTVKITYFVHGTTTDNETHLATGWLPGELAAKGKEQAADLARQAAEILLVYIVRFLGHFFTKRNELVVFIVVVTEDTEIASVRQILAEGLLTEFVAGEVDILNGNE